MVDESRSDAPPRRVTLSPGETVADAARKAIAFGAESLLRNQNAAESGEAEPLHQLRVASRRLRATIELFASVIYAAQLKIFRRDIPWIAHQAGACRECDVTSALIAARAGKIGTGLDTAIAPMIATLEEQRKAEHAKLYELLGSKRYQGLLAKLSRPAIKKVGADRRLGVVAGQLIRPASRGAARLGEKLGVDAPTPVFHKLRVRIKRLRYELEMMAPLGAKRHRKALARLEALQELLGLYHDTTVAIAWLLSYAETAAAPPRTVLAAGALIQSLGKRESKLRRQCMKAWKRFERSDSMRGTLGEIRKAGRLSLMPVSAPAPLAENGQSRPPAESQVTHSNHNSIDSHSATATMS
ncbi:MAG TPA: CHAD domain-containing protein [Candidatus Acidoferrales bacterium]|nr:CHAD domain-containing protein [Candidatus Acidoferrales bacterium]